MLSVSDLFKSKVNEHSRAFKSLLFIDFIKEWDYPFATVQASTVAGGFSANGACNGRIHLTDYKIIGQHVSSEISNPEQGWKGTVVSNETGALPSPEILTITYNEEISASNFWVIGMPGEYPVDFRIEVSADNSVWQEVQAVTNNAKVTYHINKAAKYTFKYLKVTITKISNPNGNARIIEAGAIATVILDDQDIADFEVIQDSQRSAGSPIGSVSANTFVTTLRNDDKFFTTANVDSPFYGLIVQGVRMRPYVGLRITVGVADEYEMVPLGEYFINEWSAPTDSLDATISCLDRIYTLSQTRIPIVRAIPNTVISDLFRNMFLSIGLAENQFEIDSNLYNQRLLIGWIPEGTLVESASKMASASNCNITIDSLGKIRVMSNFTSATPIKQWTENEIMYIDNPHRFNDTYSKVVVKWYVPKMKDGLEEVLNYPMKIPPRTTITEVIGISGPMAELDHMKIENSVDCEISNIKYGAFSIQFDIVNNSDTQQDLNVVAYGYNIELSQHITEVVNPDAKIQRTFEVDNELIQNLEQAKQYASDLLLIVSDPLSKMTLDIIGDPSLELKDVILINDEINNIKNVKVYPCRQKIDYDGGIDMQIETIRQIIPVDVVQISPGLVIEVPRENY